MLSQMQQSSTCNRTRLEILSEVSFIKMRKSRGPKTDPCNTDNTPKLHEHTPSTITHCCLAERYASIHIRSALGMPRQLNFWNSNACDMESNAFFKSRNMQSTWRPELIEAAMLWLKLGQLCTARKTRPDIVLQWRKEEYFVDDSLSLCKWYVRVSYSTCLSKKWAQSYTSLFYPRFCILELRWHLSNELVKRIFQVTFSTWVLKKGW